MPSRLLTKKIIVRLLVIVFLFVLLRIWWSDGSCEDGNCSATSWKSYHFVDENEDLPSSEKQQADVPQEDAQRFHKLNPSTIGAVKQTTHRLKHDEPARPTRRPLKQPPVPGETTQKSNHPGTLTKTFVVSAMSTDNTSWLFENFDDWNKAIYIMNAHNPRPGAAGLPSTQKPLTVSKNKGRESAAYLTWIIDNYDRLPDVAVFLHAQRYQWHNEDPMYDGVPMLKKLRPEQVIKEGYRNVRCTHVLGCPAELKPSPVPEGAKPQYTLPPEAYTRDLTEEAFGAAFFDLFKPKLFPITTHPNLYDPLALANAYDKDATAKTPPTPSLPTKVGIPCGAQFALSRAAILSNPLSAYRHVLEWLYTTPLTDAVSGRILEYSWHMMFGKPAAHCPITKDCFCETYGLCELTCTDIGSCEGRFRLPRFATIPDGWPDEDEMGKTWRELGNEGWPVWGWWRDVPGKGGVRDDDE